MVARCYLLHVTDITGLTTSFININTARPTVCRCAGLSELFVGEELFVSNERSGETLNLDAMRFIPHY